MSREPLVTVAADGLWCAAGGFHVDPWRPVERAVVTHAHSDHAAPGCAHYLAATPGAGVLAIRVGPAARIETLGYGETRTVGDVRVSLHPAGHLLGSAQVRLEHGGEVWVVSGDYKVAPDPTCAAFEAVSCDVFISECTFGLPIYRWPDDTEVFEEIHAWWRENREAGRTSVMFAYALGKAQRILAGLDAGAGPILLHGAVDRLVGAYRDAGVELPPTRPADADAARETRGRALVIAPPSSMRSPWLRKFGDVSTAFASGWMQIRGPRRRRSVDRGFVLSDHVDWPGLHRAIEATGARRIHLTHGYTHQVARWLETRGYATSIVPTRYEGEVEEKATGEGAA